MKARDKGAHEVAKRIADKLFKGRKGHASTEGVSYRNLTRDNIQDIAEAVYKLGWDHAREFIRGKETGRVGPPPTAPGSE